MKQNNRAKNMHKYLDFISSCQNRRDLANVSDEELIVCIGCTEFFPINVMIQLHSH